MIITRKLRRQTRIANEPLICAEFGGKERGNLSYVAGLGAEIVPSILITVRGDDGREYRIRLTAPDIDAINRARHVLYSGREYAWPPAWLPPPAGPALAREYERGWQDGAAGERARHQSGERCPRCNSPSPSRHPAVQFESEVQICPHPWHGKAT